MRISITDVNIIYVRMNGKNVVTIPYVPDVVTTLQKPRMRGGVMVVN